MEQKVYGNSFRKFQSISRGCPFLEIWKFRKFPVPFGISTQYASAPELSFNRVELQNDGESFKSTRHWMQNDLPQARACSWWPILLKKVRIWFPGKLWTGHLEFQFNRFTYSPARKVRKFLSSHMSEIKEKLNSECVFNFSTWSSLGHLRQSLQHDP